MKMITKLLAGAAAAFSMSASAQAAIFISIDGGATTAQSFANDQVQNSYQVNNVGGFDSITVSTDPSFDPLLLHADTIEANASGAASRDIFVVRTDASNLNFDALKTGVSGTFGSGRGFGAFSVQYRAYIDTTNGAGGDYYDESNFVEIANFTVTGAGGDFNPLSYSNQNLTPFDFSSLSGPYSIVGRFTISTTGKASLQPDVVVNGISTSVPEPATWSLMIMGFGGAGALLRSRRKLATTA